MYPQYSVHHLPRYYFFGPELWILFFGWETKGGHLNPPFPIRSRDFQGYTYYLFSSSCSCYSPCLYLKKKLKKNKKIKIKSDTFVGTNPEGMGGPGMLHYTTNTTRCHYRKSTLVLCCELISSPLTAPAPPYIINMQRTRYSLVK